MTFEDAVAAGGPLLAAWDDKDHDGGTLHLFSTESGGAQRVALTLVAERDREAMTDMLMDRHVRCPSASALT